MKNRAEIKYKPSQTGMYDHPTTSYFSLEEYKSCKMFSSIKYFFLLTAVMAIAFAQDPAKLEQLESELEQALQGVSPDCRAVLVKVKADLDSKNDAALQTDLASSVSVCKDEADKLAAFIANLLSQQTHLLNRRRRDAPAGRSLDMPNASAPPS